MFSVFSITLPIFLLIGLGYAATARELTSKDNIRGVGVFVLRFALPALIFRSLSQRNLVDILNLHYLAIYGLGSLGAFAAQFVYSRMVSKRRMAVAALSALGSSCPNSGFIGFPIAAMMVGGSAVVALSLGMVIENLILIPLALGLLESEKRKGGRLYEMLFFVFRRLTRNPLVLAILLGGGASAMRLHLPQPLFRAVDLLADASGAAALFAVGGALAGIKLQGLGRDLSGIIAAKLCLHPLLVFIGLMLAPGLDPNLAKAMIIIASSPMLSILPLIAQNYEFEQQAAATLLGGTIISFFTMSAVLAML
jgi:predicted permease